MLQTRDPNTNQIINKTEDVETVRIVPWGKPERSRFINLVCMDAGIRTMLDTCNWVDVGFITK